jgi:hypothetical protein
MWAPKHEVCERDPIAYLGGGSVNGTKNLSWREIHHPLERKRKTEKKREFFGEEFKLN